MGKAEKKPEKPESPKRLIIDYESFSMVIKFPTGRNFPGFIVPPVGATTIGAVSNLHMHVVASGMTIDESNRIGPITSVGKATSGSTSYDLDQSTDANKPVYMAEGLNNQPAALFDGLSDYLENSSVAIMKRQFQQWTGDLGSGEEDILGDLGGGEENILFPYPLTSSEILVTIQTGGTAFASIGRDQVILSFGDDESTNNYYSLLIDSDGRVNIDVLDGGTQHRVRGDTVLATGTAYTIQASLLGNGNGWAMKINDVDQTLSVVAGSNSGKSPGDVDQLNNTVLGALVDSSGPSKWFEGRIGIANAAGVVGLSSARYVDMVRKIHNLVYGAG